MLRCWISIAMLALLAGCANIPDTPEEMLSRNTPQMRTEVYTDLVRSMIAQGQYYAALAHIQELERTGRGDANELRLLRANANLELDRRTAAEADYRALLETDFAGQAYHGLGLAVVSRDLRQAVRYFNAAVRLLPTDAEVRNDLGYTLLLAGRLAEARDHLQTARELAPANTTARSNLVLSYLVEGNATRARELADEFGLSAEAMEAVRVESATVKRIAAQRASEFEGVNLDAPEE